MASVSVTSTDLESDIIQQARTRNSRALQDERNIIKSSLSVIDAAKGNIPASFTFDLEVSETCNQY
jgi:hypothetical protein